MLELALAEEELWIGEMRGVVVRGRRLLVVRTDAGTCVYEDRCPHLGVRLSEGELADGVITCRAHGHTYDAATGCGINPVRSSLSKLESVVREGQVWIDLPGAAQEAAR